MKSNNNTFYNSNIDLLTLLCTKYDNKTVKEKQSVNKNINVITAVTFLSFSLICVNILISDTLSCKQNHECYLLVLIFGHKAIYLTQWFSNCMGG